MNKKRIDYRRKKLKQSVFSILEVKPLSDEEVSSMMKQLDACMNSPRRMPLMIHTPDDVKITYFDGSPKSAKRIRITTSGVDYKILLKKYIKHIVFNEGMDYVERIFDIRENEIEYDTKDSVFFSSQEIDELKKLSK